MKIKARTKSVRNFFASGLFFAVTIILGLVVTPHLVSILGSAAYGAYRLMLKFFSFGQISEGRTSQTLKLLIAKNHYTNEISNEVLFKSAFVEWKSYLPFMIGCLALISYFSPLSMTMREDELMTYRTVMYILSANIVFLSFSSVYEAIWQGQAQAFRLGRLNIFWLVISNVLIVLALKTTQSFIFFAIVVLLATLGRMVHIYHKTRGAHEWTRYNRKVIPSASKQFKSLNRQNLIWTLLNRLVLGLDLILVGFFFGTEVVADVSLMSYAGLMVVTVVSFIPSALVPKLSSIVHQENSSNKVKDIIAKTRVTVWHLAGTSMFVGIVLNKSFLAIWLEDTEFNYQGDQINHLVFLFLFLVVSFKLEMLLMNSLLKIKEKIKFVSILIALGISSVLSCRSLNLEFNLVGLYQGLIVWASFLFGGLLIIVNHMIKQRIYRDMLIPSFYISIMMFSICIKDTPILLWFICVSLIFSCWKKLKVFYKYANSNDSCL